LALVTWTHAEPERNTAQEVLAALITPTDVSALKVWSERKTDIARLRTLQANWDGDDSIAPSYEVWSRASIFLSLLRERAPANPPKKIAVSPDGLIALEWFNGDTFIRAEIGDSEHVEWMFAIPGSPTEFRTETVAELTTPEQGQVWHRTPAVVDDPAYASEL